MLFVSRFYDLSAWYGCRSVVYIEEPKIELELSASDGNVSIFRATAIKQPIKAKSPALGGVFKSRQMKRVE